MSALRPYIFLDFDGVISIYERRPGSYYDERVFTGAKKRGRQMQGFLELIDARLIISSNWRYGRSGKGSSLSQLASTMEDYLGISYPIHAHTDLYEDPSDDYDQRDRLIQSFVKERRIKAPWLAFDDLPLTRISDQHKVVTDAYTGVTQEEFNEALEKLDSQL